MKLLLCLLLTFVMSAAGAQTIIPVDSFLGVKFGTLPEAAMKSMALKGGVFDSKSSKKNYYVFSNVPFGKRKTEYVYFRYSDDKLFEAGAYFRPDPLPNAVVLYTSVKNDVSLMYGEGSDLSKIPTTYNAGENETTAIELNNALYLTKWTEDDRMGEYNTVQLMINPDLFTHLWVTKAKQGRKR